MSQVPRSTRDYSAFISTSGGRTWVEAGLAYGPSPRFNIGLAIALQPNGCNVQVPAFGYVRPIPPPTSQVTSGDYGNTFGGSGAYWGQPVVPTSLTIVLDCLQKFIKLSLINDGFKPVFFGKKGYRWGGLVVHNFTDIMCLPVDIFGLVQKLTSVYIRSGEEKQNSILLPKSALITLPQILQGILIRKICDTNFDTYGALSPNAPTTAWQIQSVIPTRDYLSVQLPIPIATVVNAIGPVAIRGSGKNPKKNNKIGVPVFGNYQMTEQISAGGATMYSKVPKFGCLPQPGAQVSFDEAPLNWYFLTNSPAVTSVGLLATYYPFFMGAPGGIWAGMQVGPPAVLGKGQLFSGGCKIRVSEFEYDSGQVEAANTYDAWGGDAVVTFDQTLYTAYTANYSSSSNKQTAMLIQYAYIAEHLQWLTDYYKAEVSTNCDSVAYPYISGPGLLSMVSPAVAAPARGPQLIAQWFTADTITDGIVNAVVGNGAVSICSWSYKKMLSMTFLTDPRIYMASIFNPVAVYISSVEQAMLGQLASFAQMPYTTTLQVSNTGAYWSDFVLDCISEGGMINARLKKLEEKETKQREIDTPFSFKPPTQNDRTLDIMEAFLSYVVANCQANVVSTAMDLGKVDDSIKLFKETGHFTQQLATIADVVSDTQSNESMDDFNMGDLKQFGQGAVKGIKTIIPAALKLAGELVPLI